MSKASKQTKTSAFTMGAQGHSEGSQNDPKDTQRGTEGIPKDPMGIQSQPKEGPRVTLHAQSRLKTRGNSEKHKQSGKLENI